VRETARRILNDSEAPADEPITLEAAPEEPITLEAAPDEPITLEAAPEEQLPIQTAGESTESEPGTTAPTKLNTEDTKQESAERARQRLQAAGSAKAGAKSKSGLFGLFKRG
jgi:hypothetical protein